MSSLTVSTLSYKFHPVHSSNPSSNQLYRKSQGKDPSPNTHYCSCLGTGDMNHGSHQVQGEKGQLHRSIGPVLSR